MTIKVATLEAEIKLDDKGFTSGVKKADQDLDKLRKTSEKTSSSFKTKFRSGIQSATAPAVGALGVLGVAAFDASQKAADLAETQSKVGVIFGDVAGDIEKYAQGAPEALGQTQQQAMDAAATFATFGKSAKLTGSELSSFSTDMVGLSSDLASFHNVEPQEAIDALGAALRGESEPMRRFGVLLDDASMRQQALKMGLIKTTKEALTPQQKVLSAQALIMKQTSDAQGDFARTAGGAANQQRILKAQLTQAQTEMGATLLPILKDVVTQFAGMAKWARENSTTVKVLVIGVGALAAGVLVVRGAMMAWAAAQAVATAAQWAFNTAVSANPIGLIVLAIAALVAGIIWAWNNVDWFREGIIKLWEGAKAAFSGIVDAIGRVIGFIKENWQTILPFLLGPVVGFAFMIIKHWDKIKAVVERVRDWLVNAAKSIFNALTAPWRNGIALIISAINALIGLWNGLSFSISTPDIPGTDWGGQDWSWDSPDISTITPPSFLQGLATGGTVTSGGAFLVGEKGPELVNLPAGSAVTPNGGSPGNNTYNFNINSTDPDGVSREVYKVLRRIDRGMMAGAR